MENSKGYSTHAIDAEQDISWLTMETGIHVDTAASQNTKQQKTALDNMKTDESSLTSRRKYKENLYYH